MARWLIALGFAALAGCTNASTGDTPAQRRATECEAIRAANEPLADKGDIEAMFQMAQLYETGCSVPHRPGYAHLNYMYAAERGHTQAAMQLGYFYLGKGSIRGDWDKALFWFAVAERDRNLSSRNRRQIDWYQRLFLSQRLERDGGKRLQRAEQKAAAWTPRTD